MVLTHKEHVVGDAEGALLGEVGGGGGREEAWGVNRARGAGAGPAGGSGRPGRRSRALRDLRAEISPVGASPARRIPPCWGVMAAPPPLRAGRGAWPARPTGGGVSWVADGGGDCGVGGADLADSAPTSALPAAAADAAFLVERAGDLGSPVRL